MSFLPNAVRITSDLLGNAIVADCQAKVCALLAAGVSPDAEVYAWDSALFLAVRLRRVAIVKILLEAGASTKASSSGRVPLDAAFDKGSPELVGLLLAHGAKGKRRRRAKVQPSRER